MATLAEIRAKLLAQEEKSNNRSSGDKSLYPFWDLAAGKESTIRLLPDGDPENVFFWVERQMIRLPFSGIKGDNSSKPTTIQVPCMHMYNETCPIISEISPWFKDPSLEPLARSYWKKRTYFFQGLIVEDGLNEESPPANPIRRFNIGSQIFGLIKSVINDPEMEELPTDYVHGVDFKIVKTMKGKYADYATSKWSRRERPLSAAEQAAIDEHGLYNLGSFLPKKPGADELRVITEMFKASVDGECFDKEAWGQYYKPFGSNDDTTKASAPAPVKKAPVQQAAPVVEEDVVEEETAPFDTTSTPTESKSRSDDILAMIRNRQKQA